MKTYNEYTNEELETKLDSLMNEEVEVNVDDVFDFVSNELGGFHFSYLVLSIDAKNYECRVLVTNEATGKKMYADTQYISTLKEHKDITKR